MRDKFLATEHGKLNIAGKRKEIAQKQDNAILAIRKKKQDISLRLGRIHRKKKKIRNLQPI